MKEFKLKEKSIIDRTNLSVASYLRDISRFKLLTPEEEADLAAKAKLGGRVGEVAKQKLIEANLRFVVSVANQYVNDTMPLSDLISEGNIGLVKAVETFDESKGFKFISYAVWWIRQSIMAALDNSSTTLRLPSNKLRILKKFRMMDNDMVQQENRHITVQEFCYKTGNKKDAVEAILDAAKIPKLIDEPLDGETSTTYGDMIASKSWDEMTQVDKDAMHDDLISVITKCLSPRDAEIVCEYFGIGTGVSTLSSIAFCHNLSVERTRQVCLNAIEKIRKSPYSANLTQYLAA